MDIFCCTISNLIGFLLFIYCILMVVGPSTSCDRRQVCYDKIYEVFRTEIYKDENLTRLFQYAILNLRYIKPSDLQATPSETQEYTQNIGSSSHGSSEQGPQPRLLYDGNKIYRESYICNNEFAYEYYEILANLFERGRYVSSAKDYCNQIPDTPMYKEDKKDCPYALLYYGFTAEGQEDIIRYAYSKIVLDDITSDRRFRDDMQEPNQKRFAKLYLQQIAAEVNVIYSENMKDTAYSFCMQIDDRLPENK